MNAALKGSLLAIVGTSLWGILGIFTRSLYTFGYSAYEISFIRCLFTGLLLFTLTYIHNPHVLKIDKTSLAICVLYGGLAIALPFIFSAISLQRTPVAIATVLMFMTPIWVAILGIFIFKDRLKLITALSILFCIIGACLVSNIFKPTGEPLDFLGVSAGILNSIGIALQMCIPKYYAEKSILHRDTMLVYGFISAAIMLSFFADFTLIKSSFVSPYVSELILNILGISILCTTIANTFFVKSAQYINATTATILSAFEVIVGTAVGYILYRELLGAFQIVGIIIIVIAALSPSILEVKNLRRKNNSHLVKTK